MKEGYKISIVVIGVMIFAIFLTGGIVDSQFIQKERDNKILLDEGIITDLSIQNDGGLASWKLYIVELDGKDYETTEETYILLRIGDHIRIYKGGKIEVL